MDKGFFWVFGLGFLIGLVCGCGITLWLTFSVDALVVFALIVFLAAIFRAKV